MADALASLPVGDLLTRLDGLERQRDEVQGRAAGWCSGANRQADRAIASEIGEIRLEIARRDPLYLAFRDLQQEMARLIDGGPKEPGRPLGGMARFQAEAELCREGTPRERQRDEAREAVRQAARQVVMKAATVAGAAVAKPKAEPNPVEAAADAA